MDEIKYEDIMEMKKQELVDFAVANEIEVKTAGTVAEIKEEIIKALNLEPAKEEEVIESKPPKMSRKFANKAERENAIEAKKILAAKKGK